MAGGRGWQEHMRRNSSALDFEGVGGVEGLRVVRMGPSSMAPAMDIRLEERREVRVRPLCHRASVPMTDGAGALEKVAPHV